MFKLLLATTNQGKVSEVSALLKNYRVQIITLNEFENIQEVEETGNTFLENANLKSFGYACQTGCLTLADDSGLEVEALNGKPGVFSARFAGLKASDEDNINKLLSEMKSTKQENRKAQFISVMSVSNPNRTEFNSEGICKGSIALNPIGSNGFGYDPVFIPAGYEQTFGQLEGKIKEKISHRSIALNKIINYFTANYHFPT